MGTCLNSLPTTCFKNNKNSPINSTIYSTTVGELADATSLIVLTELHGSDILISDEFFWNNIGLLLFYLEFYGEFKYGWIK